MKNFNVFCFLMWVSYFCSAHAVADTPVSEVIASIMYLSEDTPKNTYDLILSAQTMWMSSAKKDCDAQTSEIGSSSSRNELYEDCLTYRYTERKEYLSQFLCGAGIASDDPCKKQAALKVFLSYSENADVLSNRLHDFLIKNGQLDKARTLAVLDAYVARKLVFLGYITKTSAPVFNDIGYAMSESGDFDGAYIILSEVENKSSERVVLMLNLADTLWGLNQKNKAREYYRGYVLGMNKIGKSSAIPSRVSQRLLEK